MIFCFKKYYAFLVRYFFRVYYLFWNPQKVNLRKYLSYCSNNIKTYLKKGDSIENYGYIGKKIILRNFNSFISNSVKVKNTGYTSGTTGTPMKYFRDINSMAAEQFFQREYFQWDNKYLVVLRGEKIFSFKEAPFKVYKKIPFIRELYVSSYHLNDNTMEQLVKELNNIENKCLWAYPTSAYILADFCDRKGLKLKFDIVATSSEKVYPYQAEKIERVFGTKLKDWYGQCERVAAFIRCERGNYHEIPNYSFIEYLNIKDNIYEVVGSTLHNKVMPLIRFKTGDYVEIAEGTCPCGYKGKCITTIHGRSSDFLDSPNGKIPGGLLNYAFKKVRNIKEAQIVQRADKTIVIRVVRGNNFTAEDEMFLKGEMFKFLPEQLCILEYVDRIDREKSGKYRLVINEGAS